MSRLIRIYTVCQPVFFSIMFTGIPTYNNEYVHSFLILDQNPYFHQWTSKLRDGRDHVRNSGVKGWINTKNMILTVAITGLAGSSVAALLTPIIPVLTNQNPVGTALSMHGDRGRLSFCLNKHLCHRVVKTSAHRWWTVALVTRLCAPE